MVCGEKDLARLFNDGLGDAHLAVVKVNKRPGFVDAATDNYRLSGSSLLIDAGSAAAPAM